MNSKFDRSRRTFIKNTSTFASMFPLLDTDFYSNKLDNELSVNIFSKHLQFLDYSNMAKVAADIGFDGVDLTVRPKGHVEPENVLTDLPMAISAIRIAGLKCEMITTAVQSASDKLDRNVLEVAASQGVKYYRCNWFKYQDSRSMEQSLDKYRQELKTLSELNKTLGIVGCYQNHAGTSIGSSLWELEIMLKDVDPKFFGVQYDIRHAVVEGGYSWENGLRLIRDRIKTIVIKDFKWKNVDGIWKVVNTPIGEGMVDFKKYFGLLKKYRINVPVSLHLEYPLGGAEHGDRNLTIEHEQVYQAMRKDLNIVRQLWKQS